jgi:hypothetical protein
MQRTKTAPPRHSPMMVGEVTEEDKTQSCEGDSEDNEDIVFGTHHLRWP